MNRIKISVPKNGRILTLGIDGPVVTPIIVELTVAEAILRECHKVNYHKVDGSSEELTLQSLYILMDAEQLTPAKGDDLKGEKKIKTILGKLGVTNIPVDANGSLGGVEGLKPLLSQYGTVKSTDSITGVDNMLDTLADWGFNRNRLDADETTVAEKIVLVISNLFNQEFAAFAMSNFNELDWLPESMTSVGMNPTTYGMSATFRFAQKADDFYGWQASPAELERLYATDYNSIYIIGDTDTSALRDKVIALVNNKAYDITVIGAEDENVANWVADSALNPGLYETEPFNGYAIVFPPKNNM